MRSFIRSKYLTIKNIFSFFLCLSSILLSPLSQATDKQSNSTVEPVVGIGLETGLPVNSQEPLNDRAGQGSWLFLQPYTASYNIYAKGEKLGKAKRELMRTNQQWQLKISTQLKKWLIKLTSEEFSRFKIQQNKLLVDQFYSKTKVSFKKARVITQNFDWDKKLESGSKGKSNWQIAIHQNLYDRMSHILQLRADLLAGKDSFNYQVSYKGKIKNYYYTQVARETVSTGMGEHQAIKLERLSGDDSIFTIWISPQLNYFPIKIAQFEQDKPDLVLLLDEFNYTAAEN